VLAQDLVSNLAVPGFERAMMDGYAVRSEDLAAVSADHSARLVVVGESLPGRPFAGEVACGAAVRIMTGAPFPLGAGAVIPVELTQQTADSDILILGKVPPGKHVGRVGEDISKGERLLAAGRKLRPQDVAAASSIGIRMLPVFQRPRVRIVLTGSELLPAGSVPAGYQITDSNGPLLQSIVLRDTGLQIPVEYIGDDSDRLRQVLAEPTDILLVSGGQVSVRKTLLRGCWRSMVNWRYTDWHCVRQLPLALAAVVHRSCFCFRATRSPACVPEIYLLAGHCDGCRVAAVDCLITGKC
jgi:molybdopterin molybdotransferase